MFVGDAGLLADFVTESTEGLSEIESDFLAIEAAGAEIDLERVNRVFRAIHSIKGAAGFLGLSAIGRLSHNMEHLLSQVRNRELTPTPAIVEQLLRSTDLLKQMLERVETSNEVDVQDHVAALESLSSGRSEPAGALAAAGVVRSDSRVPSGFCVAASAVDARRAAGERVFDVTFDLLHDREALDLTDLAGRIRDVGAVLDSHAEIDAWSEESSMLPWRVLCSTVLEEDHFATFFGIPRERIREYVGSETSSSAPSTHGDTPESDPTADSDSPQTTGQGPSSDGEPRAPRRGVASESPPSGGVASSGPDASIRVSVPVLNRLMNLAGELVLSRNQLLEAVQRGDHRSLELVSDRLNRVTSELQEAVMQTRMQPIGTVFSRFTRVVRDLSRTLGKQCELVIEGKDVELDRTIIEAIGDPLTHLVRNAMDHGLEAPEARSRAGKSPTGRVCLTARHQEGKVVLSISDDGGGIDAGRVRSKAVEKGLLTPDAARTMSDRDAVQLIFAPGLSTSERVTDVSGRGVGMDVVKTNFERLGGSVEIETEVGRGTTVLVRLPLTLAIIPSLIVECRGQRFAIPQVGISELVRIRPEELTRRIGQVNRSEVLRLRGSLLPLVRLSEFVEPAKPEAAGPDEPATYVVVVESGRLRYGLVVDGLHDSEEIVVKPLGRHLKGIKFLSGATVLGDGGIALILDAGGLAERARLQWHEPLANGDPATEGGIRGESMATLLFSNHPEEWFGVLMSDVVRIERIHSDQIETVASRQILQYGGRTLTLASVESHIDARPRADQKRLYVVVVRRDGRETGLIAPELLDIRELPVELDTVSFHEPGVLGSAVVDGRPVRVLDVYDFGRRVSAVRCGSAIPHAASPEPAFGEEGHCPPTVLLAEDSKFFRNRVKQILERDGWTVIDCEDGQAAWDKLAASGVSVDVVLTDIEMPRMNGFDLCRQIRGDSRYASLPVIALTSLAEAADRALGDESGVSDYLVKLDHGQLLSILAPHLEKAASRTSCRGPLPMETSDDRFPGATS